MSTRTNYAKLKHDPLRDEFPTSKELAQEMVVHIADKVAGQPDKLFGDSSWIKYMEKRA